METQQSGEKLKDLNDTLTSVENELLRRKVDRQDVEIDSALDVINKAAEAGAIEVKDCDDNAGGGTDDVNDDDEASIDSDNDDNDDNDDEEDAGDE
jgi:hypothetical protein